MVGRSERAPDVAIVGAGIVGCAAAAQLAEAGASVVVVEREGVGAGASGRNQGVLQHPFDPVLAPLHVDSLLAYRELADGDAGDPAREGAPFGVPDEPDGLLLVTRDAGRGRDAAAAYQGAVPELAPSYVSPAELASLEPSLADGLAATRLETGFAIPPAAATDAFARRARRAGATFRLGGTWRVLVEDGVARGVTDGRSSIRAGTVLVAAGAWSAEVLRASGIDAPLPVAPLWGVVATVRLERPPRHVIEEDEVSGEAWRDAGSAEDGTSVFSIVTLGGVSGVGAARTRRPPDEAAVARMLIERGSAFVPGLAAASVEATRACPRPLSQDGRPFLGPIPGVDRLFVAAGHGPWGISTGPASAALVVASILQGAPVPAPLSAARAATAGTAGTAGTARS